MSGSPYLKVIHLDYLKVIHLDGKAAAIVPLAELRRLRAVERHASREALEEAKIESTLAAHDEWCAVM